jgi:hypothetical protein
LQALREVEGALVLGDTSERNLGFTRERVFEARAADRLAKQRYQRGVASMLTLLETERRLRLAEQAIITATADVWNARIDLFLALGGDWDTNLPEAEAPSSETAATSGNNKSAEAHAKSEIPNSEIPKSENLESTAKDGWAAIPNSSFLIPNSKEVS